MPALASCILYSSFSHAEDIEPVTFKQAYEAYQTALEGKDRQAVVNKAEQAYLLGKNVYKNDFSNQAALVSNFASAVANTAQSHKKISQEKKQAYDLYQQALSLYKKAYPSEPVQLIEPYLNLSRVASNRSISKKHLNQAFEIANDTNDELLIAQTKYAAFNLLKQSPYYSKKVRNYALNALEVYQEKLPENSVERIQASYSVAKIRLASQKYNQAEALFLEVIKQLETLDYSHPYELASHAMLVELYERRKNSDASTKHCIAIGKMKPWNDSQEQIPIFRMSPQYPMTAVKQGKSGFVTMSFAINESGIVTNPKIIDSKGGKGFEKASLKALKKWRFAPKFENGKAVKAEDLKVTLDFSISS